MDYQLSTDEDKQRMLNLMQQMPKELQEAFRGVIEYEKALQDENRKLREFVERIAPAAAKTNFVMSLAVLDRLGIEATALLAELDKSNPATL